MDYVYLALEWDPVQDVLDIKCAYTKRYNLENWLKKYFEEKTTFVGLKCYRVRGGKSVEINPYDLVRVDPGEL